jgi:hypothetical protein
MTNLRVDVLRRVFGKWRTATATAISCILAAQALSVVWADDWWRTQYSNAATDNQPSETLVPFDATGLPAGSARGIPRRMTLPAGFNLKHAHGGPTYVYVIAGHVDITTSDGTTMAYGPGDFFWEPVGSIHTASAAAPAELFVLHFLAPGAEATIPAP